MKTLKLFSVVALLMMLVCAKGFAQDGDDKIVGKATARAEKIQKQFKLTDDQYKSVYDLLVSTMQKENALWTSGKSRMDMEAAKDQIHNDFLAGIKKVFTEKQFAKFDSPETKSSIKEGAKWRSAKMKESLGLSKKQTKSIYNLIVSTTTKQNEINASGKEKNEIYAERIKLDDEYYASVKEILNADQMTKFNARDY